LIEDARISLVDRKWSTKENINFYVENCEIEYAARIRC